MSSNRCPRTMKQTATKQNFPPVPLQAWAWAVPFALWAVLLLMALVVIVLVRHKGRV